MSTLVVTFAFASDAQSFSGTAGAASVLSYDGAVGNPAGALKSRITGKNKSNANNWARTLTYEAMGIPANSVITGITAASMQSKCTEYATGASSTHGSVTLVDGATTVTLSSTRNFTTTDANFVTTNGVDSTGLSKPSNNSVTITINNTLATGNSTSAAVTLYQDQLTFTITYTTTLSDSSTEAGSAADAPSSAATFASADTEAGSGGDAPAATMIAGVGLTEAGAATDALDGGLVLSDSISEAAAASENADRTISTSAELTEAGTASESADRTISTSTELTEAGTASESADRTISTSTELTEAGAASEDADRTISTSAELTEAGTASESADRTISTNAAALESNAASESADRIISTSAELIEAGAAVDETDWSIGGIPADVIESGMASDASSAVSIAAADLSEISDSNADSTAAAIFIVEQMGSGAAEDGLTVHLATACEQVENGSAADVSNAQVSGTVSDDVFESADADTMSVAGLSFSAGLIEIVASSEISAGNLFHTIIGDTEMTMIGIADHAKTLVLTGDG